MLNFDPRAEQRVLAVWDALRMAELRGEAWMLRPLRKARAQAAKALCSDPKTARKALRRARQLITHALALGPSEGLAAILRDVHTLLIEGVKRA